MSDGTPTKLSKAISNAIDDYNSDVKANTEGHLKNFLKLHIADFIRNKLSPIRLADNLEGVDKYVEKFVNSLD